MKNNPLFKLAIAAVALLDIVLSASSRGQNLAPTSLLAIANGQLTNNGAILVNTTGAGYTTKIRFDADATLGGNGSVTLNGIGTSADVEILNSFTVTHAANHMIHGKGTING